MTTTDLEPLSYPFNEHTGLGLAQAYDEAQHRPGLIRVQLAYGEPAWLATRYADARLVLGDQRFSRAMGRDRDEPRHAAGRSNGILSMDPPDHTRLRTLVAKAFTVRRVERLRPAVRQLAEELAAGVRAAGPPADLVEDFALPLPVGVICRLLGVPEEDRPRFRAWSDAALSTSRLTAEEFAANRQELRDYMAALVREHREAPRDDLMTALIDARDADHDRLTELELVDLCIAVLVAGHETTATQIPNFVFTLLERPDDLARLRDDPELLPAAVEELLRFVPLGAGAGFPRYATEDVEVGGTLVRAGEPVMVAVGAANRDALRFDAPGRLVLDRGSNQHLGFGHGVHHCLGAPLARVELQEALRVLLGGFPGLRPAGDVEWKSRMLVRGPRRMPVGW